MPPTYTFIPVPWVASGMVSSRRWLTRSWVAYAEGEVFGVTEKTAAVPLLSVAAGETDCTSPCLEMSCWSLTRRGSPAGVEAICSSSESCCSCCCCFALGAWPSASSCEISS